MGAQERVEGSSSTAMADGRWSFQLVMAWPIAMADANALADYLAADADYLIDCTWPG